MALTEAEQYLIELINRARLDPAAEAARQKYGLNVGLPGSGWDAITTDPKEPLAFVAELDTSATGHSRYMAATNYFSHVQRDGTTLEDRLKAAGFSMSNAGWGENIAGVTNSVSPQALMDMLHANLFKSAPHRANMIGGNYREIGVALETNSQWKYLTENFGLHRSTAYVTGVAYTDRDRDEFYDIGEGRADLQFRIVGGSSDRTEAPGGYALSSAAGKKVTVAIGEEARVIVDLADGNVKLDVVNGKVLLATGDIELVSGISDAKVLGIAAVDLIGSAANNQLTGNDAANALWGKDGDDILLGEGGKDLLGGGAGDDSAYGGTGNDSILGEAGNDRLWGGDGNDTLRGDLGNDAVLGEGGNDRLYGDDGRDRLEGGDGNDTLYGGAGNDRLAGDAGADKFVFNRGFGDDTIGDFNVKAGDKLLLDDALWTGTLSAQKVVATFAKVGADGVEFDFGTNGTITLTGLTSLSGLAAAIEII